MKNPHTTRRRILTRATTVGALLGGLALRGRGLKKAAGAYSTYATKLRGLGGVRQKGMVRTTVTQARAASFRLRRRARGNRNLLRALGVGGGAYAFAPAVSKRRGSS